ncbi:CatB-related O-acetyltransferase [Prevotella heparinolytica]|nr:CatB-related O-acetyltransferase [Bacteroides heparinolyticus]
MLKYILGFFKYIFNKRVSLFARIDSVSAISRKATVYRHAQIFNSRIDDYSYVGVNTKVICAEVGRFCSIGESCICGMGVHTLDCLSTSPIFTERTNALGISWVEESKVYPFKKLSIGNDVWIGARVMIMGGLNIGDGAVIGAGAIVTKDVPPYAVVAGVPAKIIRYRFNEETIDCLLKIKWWNLSEEELTERIGLFQNSDVNQKELGKVFNNSNEE